MNNRKPLMFANFGGGLVYIREVLSYRTRVLKNDRGVMRLARVRTQTGAVLDVPLRQLVVNNKY